MKKEYSYNEYKLLRNANLAIGNFTLGAATFGASLIYYGVRTPNIVAMSITSLMATTCLYKLAYDYDKNAKIVLESEKELKK